MLYLSLFLAGLLFSDTFGYSGDDIKALTTQLFVDDNYSTDVRPLKNQSQPLIVRVDFFISSIIEFNEQEESLTTSGYVSLVWYDEYLEWDPILNNGIETLFIPQDKIWKPDASLLNSFRLFTGFGDDFFNARVSFKGVVIWDPFTVLKSTCGVDITYFPFDTQKCTLSITAWSYSINEVKFEIGLKDIGFTSLYSPNSAWKVVDAQAEVAENAEAGIISFNIHLKRKPLFYLLNVVAPVVMLTFLNIATFILPITSGERASYSITVFLSLAVFLTIVASELPKNSDVVSLFGIYLMAMSCLSTVMVIVCLVQSRLAARDVKQHQIRSLYMAVYVFTQCVRCKTAKNKIAVRKMSTIVNHDERTNTLSDMQDYEHKDIDNNAAIDWIDIVNAFDFLFFWFCVLYTFVCTTVLFIMAANH